ncbi:MAG: Gfo/Idh/MocA family oxidoreductase [Candidatus Omnitrophica bacterium]|nr:MAG: Alpha-N-acetylgalactosaminidase [Candidatus Hinthialibacteria bacterium OLB16]MBE7489803.1 Gfo/Idh/MocA family oxidoreductase [bacterium]MBK7495272.1 Gfo/Idh/MocA family oxidoreductase [Candidatus Omnitrophota bacterium]MCE7908966.1 gfo/Idh/MocA family oxidoreductase [Candidatus Omnitrophica bacterium COP1]MBV6483503.1 Inositol 2-dehydrogenase/D-chiro-inositol 3-dehydrogenase [bacterium]
MAENVNRRDFIKGSATVAAGAAVGIGALRRSTAAWAGANDRVRVAVIGVNGQGKSHLSGFSQMPDVEVATICDIDERLYEPRSKEIFEDKGLKRPAFEFDIRKVLDDKNIDAISIATPNHWHSLATIWACQAGKDVYVEKPISHEVAEGRKVVEAAAKYNRIVQHGTQVRSSPGIIEAIQKLHEGVIGEVYLARGLCYKTRDTIGRKQDSPVPEGVHYDIWLGPAAQRPFRENRFHYNWHWYWDFGNGDIGNQGIHQMDIARWGLGVGLPKKVSASGGKFLFDDDKEVPNLLNVTFSYPDAGKMGKMLCFEVRPWITNDEGGARIGVLFYGSDGYMVIDSYNHYQVYLGKDRTPGPTRDEGGDHKGNFIDAIRKRDKAVLHAPPEEGHPSAALCHLANISYRLNRDLAFDPEKEKFVGDEEADAMLTRKYREPFVVPENV